MRKMIALAAFALASNAMADPMSFLVKNKTSDKGIVFQFSAPSAECDGNAITGITHTRTSTGACTKTDGTIVTISANLPRYGVDGLLQEGASTNVALRSEEIDNASWTKTNSSISATNSSAPTGNVAETLLANAGSARHNISGAYTATAAAWTCSAIVKAGSGITYAWLSIDNGSNYTHFNLSTGAKATEGAGNTGRIRALASSYYRIEVTRTMGAGATNVHLGMATVDAAATFAAAGTETLLVTAMQCEAGDRASSYITTLGTSAARTVERSHYLISPDASFAAGGSISGTTSNSLLHLATPTGSRWMNPAGTLVNGTFYFAAQFGAGGVAGQFTCVVADGTGTTVTAPGTATGTTDTFKCVLTPTTLTACLNGSCSAETAHGRNTSLITANSFDFGWLRNATADRQSFGGLTAACLSTKTTGCP